MNGKKTRFIVFMDGFSGKSKDKGSPFNCVSLAEVTEDEDGITKVHSQSFFTEDSLVGHLVFGDIVEAKFEPSVMLGGKPRLVGLTKVADSPYFNKKEA